MHIENMTFEDLEKIENILQSEFDDFWNNNILKEELSKKECKYIVAKLDDGTVVGFAGILINYDFVEIMNIVVRKKYRGQGFGHKLLEELINISKQNNFNCLNLEVNEKNISAIKLYEKVGFERIGVRKKYYNNIDDAILMEKNINIKI